MKPTLPASRKLKAYCCKFVPIKRGRPQQTPPISTSLNGNFFFSPSGSAEFSFLYDTMTSGTRTIAPSRVLSPLNVKVPVFSPPALCATNESPHITAARMQYRGPKNLVFLIRITPERTVNSQKPPTANTMGGKRSEIIQRTPRLLLQRERLLPRQPLLRRAR